MAQERLTDRGIIDTATNDAYLHVVDGGVSFRIKKSDFLRELTATNTALQTTYDNTGGSLSALNVKDALDELDAENTALNTSYVNTGTDLIATNVQTALNELDSEKLADAPVDGIAYARKDGSWAIVEVSGGTAILTTYSNVDSNLVAINVKAGLDELDAQKIPDAPLDGGKYVRQNGLWVVATGVTDTNDFISNVVLTSTTLTFTGSGGAFNGTVNFSDLPTDAVNAVLDDTLFAVTTGATVQAWASNVDTFVENLQATVSNKQDTLVSGTNIKTINGESLLGATDIVVTGGGGIDTIVEGTNITVDASDPLNPIVSATGTPTVSGAISNYPYANEVTFGSSQEYIWIKDYVLDVEISGDVYKTDGTLRKFRFTYLTATQIFLEAETLDGLGYTLVKYTINGAGFGTEIAWFDLDTDGESGITARLKLNPDARGGNVFSNKKDIAWSQIEPMIIKRGAKADRSEIATLVTKTELENYGTSRLWTKNNRTTDTDLGLLTAIKDIEFLSDEDKDMDIAVSYFGKSWLTYGNSIGFQVYREGEWQKYIHYINLTDTADNGATWVYLGYDDIRNNVGGSDFLDHYSDTAKIRIKIDWNEIPTGVSGMNNLWLPATASEFYLIEPFYLLSKDVFKPNQNDGADIFKNEFLPDGNGFGDFNYVTGSDFVPSTLRVANHRWDKQASYCQTTDTYAVDVSKDYWSTELLCMKHNFPVSYMVKPFLKGTDSVLSIPYQNRDKLLADETGRLGHGLYLKGNGYENEYTTDIPRDVLISIIKNQLEAFHYHFHRYPTVFSWSVAIPEKWRQSTPYALANRIASTLSETNTWAGFNFYGLDWADGVTPLGIRNVNFPNYISSHVQQQQNPRTGSNVLDFDTAFNAGGLYHYFEHLYSVPNQKTTLDTIAVELATRTDVYHGTYSDVMGYKYYRDNIDTITGIDFNDGLYSGIVLKLELTDKYPNYLYPQSVNTPITVFIDLTGTSLAGLPIKLEGYDGYNLGIESLGTNQYNVELPNPHVKEGTVSFRLIEAVDTSDYFSLTQPNFVSQVVVGNVLTVITDRPTKAVLYSTPTSAEADQINTTLVRRSNELKTTHVFNVEVGTVYYVGIITKEKQSKLGTVITP